MLLRATPPMLLPLRRYAAAAAAAMTAADAASPSNALPDASCFHAAAIYA